MKKKILFFITSLNFGGTEKATISYLNALSKLDNIELYLCVMFKIDCIDTLEQNISDTVKIIYLTESRIGNRFVYMQNAYTKGYLNKIAYGLFKLKYDYLLESKFDKIIRQYTPSTLVQADSVMPSYISKYKDLQKIVFVHFSVDHIFSSYLKEYRINRWLKKLNHFDNIIAVSKGIYSQLSSYFDEERLHLLYNPLFTEEIQKLAKQDFVLPAGVSKNNYIVSVGRLDENQKDFASLIRAVDIIKQKYSKSYNLLIVGQGRDMVKLQKLVEDLGMKKSVIFMGNQKNPYPYIQHSALFVLSTKFEGFGIVLQEALLLDQLIISSDCFTGPAEILNHEKLLAPVGDKAALADRIYHLLEDPQLQLKMRQHLDNQKEIFNPMNSINKIESLFD
jgi:glycosyltransferase involved in cell wall biosynthesis